MAETPIARAIVETLQKVMDNAISTNELRVRLRGKWDTLPMLGVAIGLVVVTMALMGAIPGLAEAFGRENANWLFGAHFSAIGHRFADTLVCLLFPLVLVSPFIGFALLTAFSAERAKSTLVFLLTTPMPVGQIVFGKAAGILLPSVLLIGSLSAWVLALSLVGLPWIGVHGVVMCAAAIATAVLMLLGVSGLALAGASLFPRMTMASGGWVFGLLAYFGVQFGLVGMMDFWRFVYLSGFVLWGILAVAALLAAIVGFSLAALGVQRMRYGDMNFGISTRKT